MSGLNGKKTWCVLVMAALIAGTSPVQANILGGTSHGEDEGLIEILDRDKLFSTSEKKQLEEVQKDPMVLRFAKSRKKKRKNPHEPIYHLTSPAGNAIQDPVAFCYWNGRYHMFYMIWVHDLKTGKKLTNYWGHYVSKDLVHWKDYPIGFYQPNKNIKDNKCFAGSAYAEKDRVLAIMMSTGEGAQVFESRDPLLLNWKKIPDYEKHGVSLPSIGADAMGNPYRVWDPFLFKDADKYYTICGMFTGLGGIENEPKRRAVWHLFESENLEKWDFIGNLLENDPFTPDGEDGSCSYMWPLGHKHLLTFFSHNSGTQHFLGEYDSQAKKFIPESHALQHAGPSTSLPDPKSKGKIIIVNNLGTVYSMPRRFSLGKYDTVLVEPAGDMSLLHSKETSFENIRLKSGEEKVFDGVQDRALEIMAKVQPGNSENISLNVFRSEDGRNRSGVNILRDPGFDKNGGKGWRLKIAKDGYSIPPECWVEGMHLGAHYDFIKNEERGLAYSVHPPFYNSISGKVAREFVVPNAAGKSISFSARKDRMAGNGVDIFVTVIEGENERQLARETVTKDSWVNYSIPLRECEGTVKVRVILDAKKNSSCDMTWLAGLSTVDENGERTQLKPQDSILYTFSVEKRQKPITFVQYDNKPIEFRVFLDQSIIEAFGNKQAYSHAKLSENEMKQKGDGLSLEADGTGTVIESLQIWEMNGIW